MKESLKKELVGHMIDFGLHVIGRGVYNATYSEMYNPYNHAMSIVHAAHGAELILKARIAEEHPLLIFSNIPASKHSKDGRLGFLELLEKGQSIMYSELPERLWATTGYKIPDLKRFEDFGKLRNKIVHLAIPEKVNLAEETFRFSFQVIESMVNEWWDLTILDYFDAHMDSFEDIFEQLDRYSINVNYYYDDYELKKKEPSSTSEN